MNKMDDNKTGVELIAEERQEQISKHGKTTEYDVETNVNEQLREGAIGLLLLNESNRYLYLPDGWDIESWDKMSQKPYISRLIIAGALIAAEIDRVKMSNLEE